MLNMDITEVNAVPVAYIFFANASYIRVVGAGLILIAEISVGFLSSWDS